MKKIYLLTLLSIFSLNLYCQVHWTKHPDNPVMVPGSPGEWDEKLAAPGSVIYHEGMYHMWYWGGDLQKVNQRIGHATSMDGITWIKDENNPVLEAGPDGSWDATAVGDPTVIFHDSMFHMWYEGIPFQSLSNDLQIGYATSPDGINWTKNANNPVLKLGQDGEWDDIWVSQPEVIHNGSEYHMWYGAWSGSEGIRIGHATSPDGITWTKDPSNPVLSFEVGSWDYPRVDFPEVIFDGTTYHMWYSGGDFTAWETGYTTSEDGSIWKKYSGNPVLSKGTSGIWDEDFVAFCRVIDSAGVKYKMWYLGGQKEASGSIGYAESDARLPALWVKSDILVDATDTVIAEIHKDGIIYIVPEGTSPVNDSIVKYKLASVEATSNTEVHIPLIDIPAGQYTIIAVSNQEFVSPNPFPFQVIPTGVQENTYAGIYIYPNPAYDLLTIATKRPDLHTIEITSLNGQLLYSTKMEGPTFQIDLTSFQKGFYFITVRSWDYVRTEKIIKL